MVVPCVSLPHRCLAAVIAWAARAELPAPCAVELRLDRMVSLTGDGLAAALAALGPGRCVVTCRGAAHGGESALSDAARLGWLARALAAGAAWVDLELPCATGAAMASLRRAAGGVGRILVSVHAAGVPVDVGTLTGWYRAAAATGADVVKVAYPAATLRATVPLATLLAGLAAGDTPCLGIAMGAAGIWSRLLAGRFPAPPPFTFAALAHDGAAGAGDGDGADGGRGPVAAGQISWREMLQRYRTHQVTATTPAYGLLGDPIDHSLSPWLHNTVLQAAGRAGLYLPFAGPEGPAHFVAALAGPLGVVGLSVTTPHKEAAAAAAGRRTRAVRAVGAANTLWRTAAGTWAADNTDGPALTRSLATALGRSLVAESVAVLGTGGAARAAARALRAAGATVWLVSRDPHRGADVAARLGVHCCSRAALGRQAPSPAAVVNATSVGLAGQAAELPLAVALMPAGALALDLNYGRRPTRWLAACAAAGHPTADGLATFLAQGLAQARRFLGGPVPAVARARVRRGPPAAAWPT